MCQSMLRHSSILFNLASVVEDDIATAVEASPKTEKVANAYRSERTRQEITEVELNRSKIVMMDNNGNIKRIPLIGEH